MVKKTIYLYLVPNFSAGEMALMSIKQGKDDVIIIA